MSLKLPIQGQQPINELSDTSQNFRADRSWPDTQFYYMSDLLYMLRFLSEKPKTAFYPYVLFLAMAAILVGWPDHQTQFLN